MGETKSKSGVLTAGSEASATSKAKIKKVWYKRVWVYVVGGILLIILSYLTVQGIRCGVAVKKSRERLATLSAKTVVLSYGNMTYLDRGEGVAVLSVHGIFGGYDQALEQTGDFGEGYRIIAPSRFGYLGSDVLGTGSPREQAIAFAELLDYLNIDSAYVFATSAGGTSAIRFALDFPERVKGLILFSSAMPFTEKPAKTADYIGVPEALCTDYAMFLFSPLFEPIMGMKPSTVSGILPVAERKRGIVLDSRMSNTDMGKNFDAYNVEALQMPTLILQAKDDKLSSYEQARLAFARFPNCIFLTFETGGHLIEGHSEEIKEDIAKFTGRTG